MVATGPSRPPNRVRPRWAGVAALAGCQGAQHCGTRGAARPCAPLFCFVSNGKRRVGGKGRFARGCSLSRRCLPGSRASAGPQTRAFLRSRTAGLMLPCLDMGNSIQGKGREGPAWANSWKSRLRVTGTAYRGSGTPGTSWLLMLPAKLLL